MKYDLLHIQGKPYVLVPLHDYRAMTDGQNVPNLPDDVLDALAARKDSPIKILRKHRGLTQMELAERSGLSRPYLTEMETGKKEGSMRALKALSKALDVPVAIIAGTH